MSSILLFYYHLYLTSYIRKHLCVCVNSTNSNRKDDQWLTDDDDLDKCRVLALGWCEVEMKMSIEDREVSAIYVRVWDRN